MEDKLATEDITKEAKKMAGEFIDLRKQAEEVLDRAKALKPLIETEERKRIIIELDKCFSLAPNDDSYLRILVKDTLEYLRTGKRRKQRVDENYRKVVEECS